MHTKTISHDDLRAWLGALLQTHRVMAPVMRDGVSAFAWIHDPAEVHLVKGGITKVPAKEAFLRIAKESPDPQQRAKAAEAAAKIK